MTGGPLPLDIARPAVNSRQHHADAPSPRPQPPGPPRTA